MGADVAAELLDVHRRHARKSVLSGAGFEDGSRTTVGASRKGRIWSHRRDRVDQLAAWCKMIGAKLLDETLDPDEVLKGTLEAKTITTRPAAMPITVDWPEEIYTTSEMLWSLIIGETEYPLNELDLKLISPSIDGPLTFKLISDGDEAELELELFEDQEGPNYRFVVHGGRSVQVRRGERAEADEAVEFFYDNPPVIWFSDGSALEGNQFIPLKSTHPPYDAGKIQAWDWTGVDIRKESQGEHREADSVQAKVIRTLNKGKYTMIIDDDGKGEAADIVAVTLIGDLPVPSSIDVEFYHCKYSQQAEPGQRIDDLYEVCGQAQKSVSWLSSAEKRTDVFTHLLRREARRQEAGQTSRYQKGDGELLLTIREMSRLCPVSFKIYVVQPGLSKNVELHISGLMVSRWKCAVGVSSAAHACDFEVVAAH